MTVKGQQSCKECGGKMPPYSGHGRPWVYCGGGCRLEAKRRAARGAHGKRPRPQACELCGKRLEWSGGGGRPPRFCGRRCRLVHRSGHRTCKVCGGDIPLDVVGLQTCGDACREALAEKQLHRRREKARRRGRRARLQAKRAAGFETRECGNCGEGFRVRRYGADLRRKYCSRACSRLATWRVACQRRRARISGAGRVDTVESVVVFKRDAWRCQNCGCRVTMRSGRIRNRRATVDHIQPISKGGAHTYANVQTLCWACNQSKGNRVNGDQMRLDFDAVRCG